MFEEVTRDKDDKNILEFLQIGTICTIPVDENSLETVFLVKIIDYCTNDSRDQIMTDDLGQSILPGHVFRVDRYFLHQFPSIYESKYTKYQKKCSFLRNEWYIALLNMFKSKEGLPFLIMRKAILLTLYWQLESPPCHVA